MRTNKKAIAAIVATVMLILMTLAAAGIIWGVVMPMIKKGASEISGSCVGVDLTIETRGGITCFDATNKKVHVSVTRSAGDYILNGVQVIVYGGGDSNSEVIRTDMPGKNEQKTYEVGTELTAERVAIAPVIGAGETEKTCDVMHEVNLIPCA